MWSHTFGYVFRTGVYARDSRTRVYTPVCDSTCLNGSGNYCARSLRRTKSFCCLCFFHLELGVVSLSLSLFLSLCISYTGCRVLICKWKRLGSGKLNVWSADWRNARRKGVFSGSCYIYIVYIFSFRVPLFSATTWNSCIVIFWLRELNLLKFH